MSSSSANVVLSVSDWNTSSNKYMAPKVNKSGGKAITVISKQTNRSLTISTPLMMTWGVSDFVDDKGESDGKFGITLNFPNSDYENPATTDFLNKLKAFENQILDDAVSHSELWWGEQMDRGICKHTFFPILKYSKDKVTKKIDLSRPPSIRAKVPFYDNKWGVEIYDTKSNMIFPCENTEITPCDLIPKMSSVACVLQCGGIWIGGKGWGLTWKLVQCVVKPKVTYSIAGKCQIKLSEEEKTVIENQEIDEDEPAQQSVTETVQHPQSTVVDDSDNEEELPPPEPVQESTPTPPPAPVKKVVKKATPTPTETAVQEAVAVEEPKATVVKKVVKKKA